MAERTIRVEQWQVIDDDGNVSTAIVEVQDGNVVVVAYELLAQMLSRLGGTRKANL